MLICLKTICVKGPRFGFKFYPAPVDEVHSEEWKAVLYCHTLTLTLASRRSVRSTVYSWSSNAVLIRRWGVLGRSLQSNYRGQSEHGCRGLTLSASSRITSELAPASLECWLICYGARGRDPNHWRHLATQLMQEHHLRLALDCTPLRPNRIGGLHQPLQRISPRKDAELIHRRTLTTSGTKGL